MYELLIISVVIGFLNGALAHYLDLLMTKGHIFDFVREKIAKMYDADIFNHLPEYETWSERAEIYNQTYWSIAKTHKSFTRWICPYCMSAYTFFPILVLVLAYGSWGWYEFILITLFSSIINYISVKWLA